MPARGARVVILMAEVDEDDCLLIREALAKNLLDHELRCFKDGDEMMDYLHRIGEYRETEDLRPHLARPHHVLKGRTVNTAGA